MSQVDLCISFDTTGSMYPMLAQVRREIGELTQSLYDQVPELQIAVIAHGDYCDGIKAYRQLDFSDQEHDVSSFVRAVLPTAGGDAPECYELVLQRAQELGWREGSTKAMLMIGDATPHPKGHQAYGHTAACWREETAKLRAIGVQIYAVQALGRSCATSFYKELAEMTNGRHLALSQFHAAADLIRAVALHQIPDEQNEAVQLLEGELLAAGKLDWQTGIIFDDLLGRPRRKRPARIRVRIPRNGRKTTPRPARRITRTDEETDVDLLEPVHPGQFQMLHVDKPTDIARLVREQGLAFKAGRGFCEFAKTVKVQSYKEMIALDIASGDMFSGNEARKLLGLPKASKIGPTSRIRPDIVPGFALFVQSTSWNRKLSSGTRFLYEIEDLKRS